MSRIGGYKLIDLKKNDFTDETFTINGIYNRFNSDYNKPLLLTGIVIDGVLYRNTFISPVLDSNDKFVVVVYGYTLSIDEDDLVTATVIE